MSTAIQNCLWLIERKETLVQMFEAHKHFLVDTSPSTAQRFFRRGISTPHGHFYLETVVIGGRRFTSKEAIRRFLLAQQGRQPAAQTSVPVINNGMTERERVREMKRLGLRPQSEKSRADAPAVKTPGKKTPATTKPLNRKGGEA